MPYTKTVWTPNVTPVTAASMNNIESGIAAGTSPSVLGMTCATQSIANTTVTKTNLATTVSGSHGGTALSADATNHQINILESGWYHVVGYATFDIGVSQAGKRLILAYMNPGGIELARVYVPGGESSAPFPFTQLVQLGAGATLYVSVYQDSTFTITMTSAGLTVMQVAF